MFNQKRKKNKKMINNKNKKYQNLHNPKYKDLQVMMLIKHLIKKKK